MKHNLMLGLIAFTSFGFANPNPLANIRAQNSTTPPEKVVIKETKDFKVYLLEGIGYRYDRQKTKIFYFDDSSILNTLVKLKDRNTVQATLGVGFDYQNFFLDLQGDYGWMVNGTEDISNPGNNVDEPTSFPGFKLGAGYSADAQATLGYNLKLVKTEKFKFSLVPALGYKYWHLMNWREGEKRFDLPVPPVVLPPVLTGFALDRQQSPNQQDWYGPYVQGGLNFKWFEKGQVDLFYQYHFMHLRSKNSTATDVEIFFPATTLVAQQTYRFKNNIDSNHAYAQVGGIDMSYCLRKGWQLGLHFEGSRIWSHKATTTIKTIKEEFVLPPVGTTKTLTHSHTTISWTVYMANLYASYTF